MKISAGNLLVLDFKAKETIQDLANGRLSFSKHIPVLVSYLPDQRKYIIRDGHHRAMEWLYQGLPNIECIVSEYEPRIYNTCAPVVTIKSLKCEVFSALTNYECALLAAHY